MTPSADERRRAGLIHLSGMGGLLLPLANFLLPLLLWSLWRRTSPFVELHGREAASFQFTMVLLGGSLIPVEFFVVHALIDPLAALSLCLITAVFFVVYGGAQTVRASAAAFNGRPAAYSPSLRVF